MAFTFLSPTMPETSSKPGTSCGWDRLPDGEISAAALRGAWPGTISACSPALSFSEPALFERSSSPSSSVIVVRPPFATRTTICVPRNAPFTAGVRICSASAFSRLKKYPPPLFTSTLFPGSTSASVNSSMRSSLLSLSRRTARANLRRATGKFPTRFTRRFRPPMLCSARATVRE